MTEGVEASAAPVGPSRPEAMARRVIRTARSAGTSEAGLALLERAHALAMELRLQRLADDHAPDLLHPGRTALILMLDAGETRPQVLAAALLAESEGPELRASAGAVREALAGSFGPEVAGDVATRVDAVPMSDAEDLAERLVLAAEDVQRIALAERLDQLRHAHLWPDPARRRIAHARAVGVYAPLAERVHPALASRFQWWCRMFARRHL